MAWTRRRWLESAGLLLGATALSGVPGRGRAAQAAAKPLTSALKACTPPSDPIAALMEGNRLYAAAWQEASRLRDPQARSAALARIWQGNCQIDPDALAKGQKPWLGLLSCADSRVSPEWIFANGSGEIFQVSSAGNTAFDDAIASLEYGVSVLGIQTVLVMGHSGCGAVKAAMAKEPLTPLLENLVKPIRASLVSGDSLTRAIEGNARYAAAQLTSRSAVLREAVAAGRLTIRSAFFDIGSGRVTLL